MNLYVISYLDAMVERNIASFCRLNFVKSAVYLSDLNLLSIQLQAIADFYFKFLHQIDFLKLGVFKVDYIPKFDLKERESVDFRVKQVLDGFIEGNTTSNEVLPVHIRYSDNDYLHLIAGVVKIENRNMIFLHLVDLHIPKKQIHHTPPNVSYVREIYDTYNEYDKISLRDFVKSKGYGYNQFQRDCKVYYGDTFYSFLLKQKITEAVKDIIFTRLSLKEIAFKNRFIDYPNMYKTFVRYKVSIANIPRLANL